MISIDELVSHMRSSQLYQTGLAHMTASVRDANLPGLFLEFGVWNGTTASWIANLRPDKTLYAFDSFLGLPEAWNHENPKGAFDTGGKVPSGLPANVEIVQGWFDETLPGFVEEHPGEVAFVHIDCDLYSSAKTVLNALRERIVPGTVLNFNEFWDYPGQENGEARAFAEFLNETGRVAECLGHAGGSYTHCFWRVQS